MQGAAHRQLQLAELQTLDVKILQSQLCTLLHFSLYFDKMYKLSHFCIGTADMLSTCMDIAFENTMKLQPPPVSSVSHCMLVPNVHKFLQDISELLH